MISKDGYLGRHDLQSIYFLSNAGIVIVFSYLVLLLKEKGINEKQIAYLAVPFSLALLLSNFLSGRLSDERGRQPFLIIGLFASSISTILYIFPETFWMFVLARIFNGITLGIFPSSIIGTASDRHIKLGKISSFGSIGWAVGAMMGGLLAQVSSLDYAFLISGLLYFFAFTIVYRMNTGNRNSILPIKNNMISFSNDSASYLTPSEKYHHVLRKNWLIYFTLIIRHGMANSIWLFWVLFLTIDLGLSTTKVGMVQATNMLTQFFVMRTVTDKYPPRNIFFLGGLLSSVTFFTFTISTTFAQIILTQVLLGISWAFFYVGGLRIVELNTMEERLSATGNGLFNGSISIAQLIGPFVALFLYSISETYTLSMQIAAVITLIATLVYLLLNKDKDLEHNQLLEKII